MIMASTATKAAATASAEVAAAEPEPHTDLTRELERLSDLILVDLVAHANFLYDEAQLLAMHEP